jgi:adenylylsulfate kinase
LVKHAPNLAILDGDELRDWLSPKNFSREGRNEHNRKVALLAKLLIDHKVPVCVSLISPFAENRQIARKIIGNNFIKVCLKCSLDTCIKRDVKGMYKKALSNEIPNFTGITDPYEEPSSPDIELDTEKLNVDQCVSLILKKLKDGYT